MNTVFNPNDFRLLRAPAPRYVTKDNYGAKLYRRTCPLVAGTVTANISAGMKSIGAGCFHSFAKIDHSTWN